MIFIRRIIYYVTFLMLFIVSIDIVITCELPGFSPQNPIKVSRSAAIFSSLVILFGIYQIYIHSEFPKDKPKSKTIPIPSFNIDLISITDKDWIEEIKLRKKRGDKMVAYSYKGEAAARRKAKALGLEDCFVEFLDKKEVQKRRGW